MDQRETELNTSSFSNTTRSVFYCPEDPQLPWDLHDTTSPWIFAAVASIISPTAVLLNVLVIIAVKQRKELHSASNILLSSMAVTDLLVGSICVPLSAVVGLLVPYQILTDHYICKLDFVAISVTTTLTACSIFHLTMIAWERYVAIRKWIDYKVIVTRSRLKKLAIIAWVSAIVTVSPTHFTMALTGMLREDEMALALDIFFIILSVLVLSALGLIIYFYVMVYLGVRKRKLKLSQIRQVSELVNAKLEQRVAVTTTLVTVALILSFFSNAVISMLEGVYPVLRKRFVIDLKATLLPYTNSVVNPLIYCYRDCRFRNAVLEILRIRKPKVTPYVVTDTTRFTRGKGVFDSERDKVQGQFVENPVRLTRSASCDLVHFLGRFQLESHKKSLKRIMSSPSLPISSFHGDRLQEPAGHCDCHCSDPDYLECLTFELNFTHNSLKRKRTVVVSL